MHIRDNIWFASLSKRFSVKFNILGGKNFNPGSEEDIKCVPGISGARGWVTRQNKKAAEYHV